MLHEVSAFSQEQVPTFTFKKDDLIYARSGTLGFQPKFFSQDKIFFVKAQAVISGVLMQDWLVEIIASDYCKQLDIPHVVQKECLIDYEGAFFKGVYSDNFEMQGCTFVSFESLLNRMYLSTKDDSYVKMSTADKMFWSAEKLSQISGLAAEHCLKYIVDLAVIDCLVGNSDRHTRNFGLFYTNANEFKIPLVFDSGMGLFEHDYYRDSYKSFSEAMRTVYVAPYGEDPFEMVQILIDNFDLSKYKFDRLEMPKRFPNEFSVEYTQAMFKLLRGDLNA